MEEPQPAQAASTFDQPPSSPSNGMGNCYVFKSRLQEYAQKIGISTPVYDTIKEGPSHQPVFKSTVTVNDLKYESLPGFFNRKAAEQSAAEVALIEIHKSGQMTESIPTVHESGLCKNLLQEYAQKMNYAIPSYKCNRQEEKAQPFICTVEIGGIRYIGASARTKKEAEIKAARTALLAIRDNSAKGENGASQFTVLPFKKKGKEQEPRPQTADQLKPKKAHMKKKWPKRKFPRNKGDKSAKPENDVPHNPVDKMEEVSMISNGDDENERGNVGMNNKPQTQADESIASAIDTNGSCKDEKQYESAEIKPERFEEPQEGEIMDSLSMQEVKADAGVL
ncbi:uncharacterized protein A4U43_C02F21750 [Asparagus officinalis]|uniref:DRBM domain-containing protein n=1 Tax=Asparagus officinalis TaxID=4686 RepID=A0A5P1FKR5_ASPOF|nr:double-stranded RNA-binding protein 8-like [Asparagus officinalis]ONK78722.1 uncharacterized protein A4U43_C02F21750 [Asparagus officinalis]